MEENIISLKYTGLNPRTGLPTGEKTIAYNKDGIRNITHVYKGDSTFEEVFKLIVLGYLERHKIID